MRFRTTPWGSTGPCGRRGAGMAVLLGALAALAGCSATTGPIIPTGQPGQYTLTSRSGSLTTSWVQLKSDALDRAKAYCASQGLKMTRPDVSSNHATGLMRPETYVTFNCEPIPQPKKPGQDQGGNGDTAPASN